MLTWLDQRTGLVTMTKDFLTEDVPGGASYWYTFGSATLFAMTLQIVTGIFLTFYYSPSTATAWESTKFLMEKVPLGNIVLGLHYWGASAMIALMTMHLLQALLWGAYKKPREMQWIVGVVLFLLTLVLGLTGYLLPWDLNALLASRVAINIAGNAPVLGPAILNFLQDGNGIGTLTINRFFGIHVWLIPAILTGMVVMHLIIFRHNGAAGPPIDTAQKLKPGRFWPEQVFMDALVSFIVFALIVALAIFAPPLLDAKADPNNTQFVPYPAWYFMALYALLDVVGKAPDFMVQTLTLLATIIMPGVLVAVLIVLPFIDRNPSRRLSRRPWILAITALTLIGAIGLSFFGQYNVQEQQALKGPAPAVAATTSTSTTPGAGNAAAGATVFTANCSGCHGANAAGQPGVFPPLANNAVVGAADPKEVAHIVMYGLTGKISVNGANYNGMMPPWKGNLTDQQLADVLTYIRGNFGNKGGPVSVSDLAKVAK